MPRLESSITALDPDHQAPITQEVADIDERRRLRFPASFVTAVSWLSGKEASKEALMVLDEPGRIVLLPWEIEGARIVKRRLELIEMAEHDDSALEDLRLLEDRYKRIQKLSKKDLRLTLTDEIMFHLGIMPTKKVKAYVYILRIKDRLEIWSAKYRDDQLLSHDNALPELP